MTPVSPTIFLDFDGTITIRDATDAILEAYAEPQWLAIEEAWTAGRIGSRECLEAQMALVRARPDEIDELLDQIEVDAGFGALLASCVDRDAPVHIVSDGFDYCIRRILDRRSLGLKRRLKGTHIVSSHLEPAAGGDWRVSFTSDRPECSHGCATCKPAAMERLKAPGRPTVFIGDGLSDRYAAAAADLVFAKGALAAYCEERSMPYTPYRGLATVARTLEELLESDTRVRRAFPGKAFPAT
jgi:2-hydroxy-3-keto-5-methylthiopentenyl-1-phosphate phosphatase